jgi:3-phenylpropionate/trans-cinnamate dioxygenase ferredoxin subunit
MAQRIHACSVGDLAEGEARKLDLEPPVTLFRGESGYFALDDLCTHGKASLAEGFIEGDTVECPLHMAQFCLRTGKPLCAPATAPVKAHEVLTEGGEIFVMVDR